MGVLHEMAQELQRQEQLSMPKAKVFYPETSGMTKDEVINMINERREDSDNRSFRKLKAPNIELLTDERMQEFVNDWHNMFMDVAIDSGPETACEEQEKVLLALAKLLV